MQIDKKQGEQSPVSDAGDSYVMADHIATGNALVSNSPMLPSDFLSAVDVGASSPAELAGADAVTAAGVRVEPSEPSVTAAAAADAAQQPQDLEQVSSTSASVIVARVGRASSAGNSYTPPATSRLSQYSPMLLQNSRSHAPAPIATTTTTTTSTPKPRTPFDPIIVCYLGSWSVYRPSVSKFTPENINPYLCTHIIYAFAGLSSKYELKPFDSYNDITQGGYKKFTGLKDYNKQLKTLIAVGGWNEGSAR